MVSWQPRGQFAISWQGVVHPPPGLVRMNGASHYSVQVNLSS